jgi:hypothetical protein
MSGSHRCGIVGVFSIRRVEVKRGRAFGFSFRTIGGIGRLERRDDLIGDPEPVGKMVPKGNIELFCRSL